MKKRAFSFLLALISAKIYSQDLAKINLEKHKLNPKITGILIEETKENKNLNIYQENNVIYVLGWSKKGKIAFIENRSINGRGGHDLHLRFKIFRKQNDDTSEEKQNAQTFEECLKNNTKEFNSELEKKKIILKPAKTEPLPVTDKKGNIINFFIIKKAEHLGEFGLTYIDYEIFALKNKKRKSIVKVENKRWDFVMPTAFIKSPFENKIALVVEDAEYAFEGRQVFVNFYGVELNSGFSN